jgi:hypothetical protein
MKELRKTVNGENGNQPLYAVHKTTEGVEKRFTYVQSRYFYCCAYEKLAIQTREFKQLQDMINQGVNLLICGYDAYEITQTLYTHYCDPIHPFGHELVLYTLLTSNITYPWHQYRLDNLDVYEGIEQV